MYFLLYDFAAAFRAATTDDKIRETAAAAGMTPDQLHQSIATLIRDTAKLFGNTLPGDPDGAYRFAYACWFPMSPFDGVDVLIDDTTRRFVDLYLGGWTPREIAGHHDVPEREVVTVLTKHKLQPQPRTQPPHWMDIRTLNEQRAAAARRVRQSVERGAGR